MLADASQSQPDTSTHPTPQMIGDEQRGFAWTRALLGLPANEVHVCGDTSAVNLVRTLAAECGDEFELRVSGVGACCLIGKVCACGSTLAVRLARQLAAECSEI